MVGRDRVAVNGNKTVVGVFLGVFIDETAGVDMGHVVAVERCNFFEFARVGVAAVLGKATVISIVCG